MCESPIEYAEINQAHAYMDPSLSFYVNDKTSFEKTIGKDILIAHYPNLNQSDIFASIESNQVLTGIAEKYCGVGATCIASQMWWTYPVDVSDAVRVSMHTFITGT